MAKGTSRGGLTSIDGDRKPDIVKVKLVYLTSSQAGFLAFIGSCDLDVYERACDAMEEQGYLDLIDDQGTKMRMYKTPALASCIHVSTVRPGAPKIIMPANG